MIKEVEDEARRVIPVHEANNFGGNFPVADHEAQPARQRDLPR